MCALYSRSGAEILSYLVPGQICEVGLYIK
jgi:hypothetical protein